MIQSNKKIFLQMYESVSKNLNTDFNVARMIGYLSHYSNLPEIEVGEEMLEHRIISW